MGEWGSREDGRKGEGGGEEREGKGGRERGGKEEGGRGKGEVLGRKGWRDGGTCTCTQEGGGVEAGKERVLQL